MNKFAALFILLVLFVCALSTTTKADVANQTILHIDFQGGFEGTHITFLIEGKVCFDKTLSTSPVTGLAGGFSYTTTKDSVKLAFKSSTVEFTKNVFISDGSYIGISIRDGKVALVQSKTMFYYD